MGEDFSIQGDEEDEVFAGHKWDEEFPWIDESLPELARERLVNELR